MLFNSYTFLLLFLPVVLAGCFWLAHARGPHAAALWLTFASFFFYGWWDARYVPLLAASVAFNYGAGQALLRSSGRRTRLILACAIAADIGVLAWFKYAGFFGSTVNALAGTSLDFGQIVLPLGISFFTFTQIAYLVDLYREPARYRPVPYALFVTYYPHLIAGPILHHREMMPQFERAAAFRYDSGNVAAGLAIFAIGLFKKVVLADGIAPHAAPVFDRAADGYAPTLLEAWGAALAYGLQLYFDFSGYSDMAIGLSKMLGIRLPLNFDSPYKATSIIEFWRRWHMTLSRFLRDYLYIPLGGRRRGAVRRYFNLFVTMVLGGLWHGAAWTFVAWGAAHGVFLAINHAWRAVKQRAWRVPALGSSWFRAGERTLGAVLTFVAVFAAWVLFRAADLPSALLILKGMAGMHGMVVPLPWLSDLAAWLPGFRQYSAGVPGQLLDAAGSGVLVSKAQLAWIAALLALVWLAPNTRQVAERADAVIADRRSTLHPSRLQWTPSAPWALAAAGLLTASFLGMARVTEFLYFQF
jgi:D-alanyl-lipoteichoic acid acyltransferase DltB (MBOAT superfamily)